MILEREKKKVLFPKEGGKTMMEIEGVGKTKEEAIVKALASLGIDSIDGLAEKYDYHIEEIEEKGKGLFGIFGTKTIKVKISLKERSLPQKDKNVSTFSPEEFLENLFNLMGVNAQIEVFNKENDELFMKIHSEDRGIIIGKHGETLDAIQYLLNVISSRKGYEKNLYLDLDGYREKRKLYLKRVARRAASRAISTGKTVSLDPMSTVERRYVHNLLKKDPYITTKSEGREPKRRIVIYPVGGRGGRKNKRI